MAKHKPILVFYLKYVDSQVEHITKDVIKRFRDENNIDYPSMIIEVQKEENIRVELLTVEKAIDITDNVKAFLESIKKPKKKLEPACPATLATISLGKSKKKECTCGEHKPKEIAPEEYTFLGKTPEWAKKLLLKMSR